MNMIVERLGRIDVLVYTAGTNIPDRALGRTDMRRRGT